MGRKEKDCRVMLTAMLLGTCVPAKEEMHFVPAISKKEVIEKAEELVKKKNKWDGGFHWIANQIIAGNGRIIYPRRIRAS